LQFAPATVRTHHEPAHGFPSAGFLFHAAAPLAARDGVTPSLSGPLLFVQRHDQDISLSTTTLATGGEWHPFPGDCRYEVCSLGAVRNVQTGRVLKPWLAGYGYWYVQLGVKGIKTGIHRLVALTFLGPPPTALHEVAHNDGDRNNNMVANLRWATHAENVADSFRHGTARVPVFVGQHHSRATLTDSEAREIRRRHTGGRGEQIRLAREFGVSRYVIHHIVRGETWQHLN
jgi:hypothetical protein